MGGGRVQEYYNTDIPKEKALLVGLDLGNSEWNIDDSLAELKRLAETDNAEVLLTMTQKLDHPNPATFIGKGKLEELAGYVDRLDIDVVIFDDELSPSQQFNLEKSVKRNVKIIDRTALILDIFAQHATTTDGRLQVQLAQLQYLYPRLRGMWSHLIKEQQRGGIGGRFGAGESQLEADRRLMKERVIRLKRELQELDKRRSVQAKSRRNSGIFAVSLVGYTNAGKSTLLNTLTGAGVYVRDELFATLDPTTRSIQLEEGRKITLSDTVGFIQKLPTTLVTSFNSTLQEVVNSNLLLLVLDATDKNKNLQLKAVKDVLKTIHADEIDTLTVLNKCDELSEDEFSLLKVTYPDALFVSALKKVGIENLLYQISKDASKNDCVLTCFIPYVMGKMVNIIHDRCQIIKEDFQEEGILYTLRVPDELLHVFKDYERYE